MLGTTVAPSKRFGLLPLCHREARTAAPRCSLHRSSHSRCLQGSCNHRRRGRQPLNTKCLSPWALFRPPMRRLCHSNRFPLQRLTPPHPLLGPRLLHRRCHPRIPQIHPRLHRRRFPRPRWAQLRCRRRWRRRRVALNIRRRRATLGRSEASEKNEEVLRMAVLKSMLLAKACSNNGNSSGRSGAAFSTGSATSPPSAASNTTSAFAIAPGAAPAAPAVLPALSSSTGTRGPTASANAGTEGRLRRRSTRLSSEQS